MRDFFVIAEDELVVAFRLAGVDGRSVLNRDEALAAFESCTAAPGGAGERGQPIVTPKVLVLSESVADMIEERVRDWQIGGAYPLVVEIPPSAGREPGRKGLLDAIREAVGLSV